MATVVKVAAVSKVAAVVRAVAVSKVAAAGIAAVVVRAVVVSKLAAVVRAVGVSKVAAAGKAAVAATEVESDGGNDQEMTTRESQNRAMTDDSVMSAKRLRDTINDKCIVRVPNGSKELPALDGQGYYTWQFYLRRVLLDPRCLQLICEDFWNRFEQLFELEPFQLAGVESAAVPLITALIMDGARRNLDVGAFTVRKNRKTYGLRNLIEGSPSDRPVLFVDDLTSPQHNAFWHVIHAISLSSLRLNGRGYVLVRKQNAEASPMIATSLGDVKIDSLFTLTDFSMTLEDYDREKSVRLS